MVVWVYMRHYLNLRIIWSLFTEFKTVGPYVLDWQAEQYKCTLSFVITLGLLSSLQALNLFWLFYIVRIAYISVTVHTLRTRTISSASSRRNTRSHTSTGTRTTLRFSGAPSERIVGDAESAK